MSFIQIKLFLNIREILSFLLIKKSERFKLRKGAMQYIWGNIS